MKLTYKRFEPLSPFEPLPPYSGYKSRIEYRQWCKSQNFDKGYFYSGADFEATKFLNRLPLLEWLHLNGKKPRFALRQKIL